MNDSEVEETGQIDMQAKTYVKRRDVFADLFNYLLYSGAAVIKPEQLTEMDTAEIALPFGEAGKINSVQKLRDALEKAVIMEDGKAAYVLILGIENQTGIHYAMPVKNMVYDALNYAAQVSAIARKHKEDKDQATGAEYLSGLHRDDRLLPVITLVVYFGQDPWDGPMSIHEMLSVQDENIMRYVPDYRINLIAPVSMDIAEIEKFRSTFKYMAQFIHYGHDKNAIRSLVDGNENFRHMDPLIANILNSVTGASLQLNSNEKGEIDMCAAIAGIREDAKIEGITQGMAQGMAKGMATGIARGKIEGENAVRALIQNLLRSGRGAELQRVSEDQEYCQELMKEFGLT